MQLKRREYSIAESGLEFNEFIMQINPKKFIDVFNARLNKANLKLISHSLFQNTLGN